MRQVLRHCDRKTALGRRDYAVLLLLVRLGLRAGEVVSLRLEDIDWENARITICGKGGKWSQLPLPSDVAKAIADYLRRDRPRCASRRLFIRDYAPIDGFQSASAIASLVKRASTARYLHIATSKVCSTASPLGISSDGAAWQTTYEISRQWQLVRPATQAPT